MVEPIVEGGRAHLGRNAHERRADARRVDDEKVGWERRDLRARLVEDGELEASW